MKKAKQKRFQVTISWVTTETRVVYAVDEVAAEEKAEKERNAGKEATNYYESTEEWKTEPFEVGKG